MDLKGIALYLGFSYLLVFALSFILLFEGLLAFQSPNIFQYIAQVALMGIPAVAALAAGFIGSGNVPEARLWPIPTGVAARGLLLPPVLFAVAYAVATLMGFTYPQWNLASMLNAVEGYSTEPLPSQVKTIAPIVFYVAGLPLSILLGATLFAIIAVCSEYGWRGFLLPRLLPLGLPVAHTLVGITWGLWFFPFIYGWHWEIGDTAGLFEVQLRFIALGVVLSFILGQIEIRTRHLGACALVLGGFAGQAAGLWGYLFQQSTPPWTGPAGWIMIGVLAISACFPRLWTSARREPVSDHEVDGGIKPGA